MCCILCKYSVWPNKRCISSNVAPRAPLAVLSKIQMVKLCAVLRTIPLGNILAYANIISLLAVGLLFIVLSMGGRIRISGFHNRFHQFRKFLPHYRVIIYKRDIQGPSCIADTQILGCFRANDRWGVDWVPSKRWHNSSLDFNPKTVTTPQLLCKQASSHLQNTSTKQIPSKIIYVLMYTFTDVKNRIN